jgi:hypothetical protein
MNLNEMINKLLLVITLIIISIFFIPELLTVYKTKATLNSLKIKADNYFKGKNAYAQQLEEIKNTSEILQKNKKEEISNLKNMIKINGFYGQEIEEAKSDYDIIKRKNNIMKGLIKLYENNNASSINLITLTKNFFKNNSLKEYYNNISNILITSTIIKNESDLNFIYQKIIKPFYNDTKTNNKLEYILGFPCFKATIDTNEPEIFHKKCNNVGDTIMFIKTNKTRFGGITDLSWGKRYDREKDYNKSKTRLFNLDNQKIFMYNQNHKISRYIPPIRGDSYYFAIFGYNDIYLGYLPWESSSDFPQFFLKDNNTDKRFNDLLNQKINPFLDYVKFEYEDIEVYPIIIINNTQNTN